MPTPIREKRLMTALVAVALLAAGTGFPSAAGRQAAPASRGGNGAAPRLTLEGISRDNAKWIGTPPSQVRWSVDGRSLYFNWNPEGADIADLYTLPTSGGTPTKVPLEERRLVVPHAAAYNRAQTQRV